MIEQETLNIIDAASASIMPSCRVKNSITVHFSRKYNAEEMLELIAEFQTVLNSSS